MGLFNRIKTRITDRIKTWITDRIPQPQPVPAPDRPRRSWHDWLPWNRRKKQEPEEKPDEPIPEPDEIDWSGVLSDDQIKQARDAGNKFHDGGYVSKPEPPEPPVIDADLPSPGVQYDYPIGPIPGSSWEGPEVPTVSDETLLIRYRKMLDTMVERGYIKPFVSDKEAAEFLRVLGSKAWDEAHAYFGTSETVFKDIQNAIEHGATAGALQDDYNMTVEKKSKDFLRMFENWREREWPETAAQEEKPVTVTVKHKQTRKQKKRARRK